MLLLFWPSAGATVSSSAPPALLLPPTSVASCSPVEAAPSQSDCLPLRAIVRVCRLPNAPTGLVCAASRSQADGRPHGLGGDRAPEMLNNRLLAGEKRVSWPLCSRRDRGSTAVIQPGRHAVHWRHACYRGSRHACCRLTKIYPLRPALRLKLVCVALSAGSAPSSNLAFGRVVCKMLAMRRQTLFTVA